MLGFWTNDVNPFGPVHEYEVMPFGRPVRLSVPSSQTGLFEPAVGVGKALITTVVVAAAEQVLPSVTVKV
jgi:hypothetical protein